MYLNKNNNYSVTSFLAKKNYILHKNRNLFIIIAAFITTFLLTILLSGGKVYFTLQKIETAKLIGTTADASIINPTSKQLLLLKKSSLIENIGIQKHIGTVRETGGRISISYIDKEEWEKHRVFLTENRVGEYPLLENEIMIPIWILNDLGISNPKIGMKIFLPYYNNNELKEKTFILSGYFKDNSYIRSNKKGSVYVSEAYALTENSDAAITLFLDLKGKDKEKAIKRLSEELNITSEQSLSLSPQYKEIDTSMLLTIAFLVLLIIFSGYLVIYSIFYLSLAADIKMYGKLVTIGMTEPQIKKILLYQIKHLCILGVPIGGIVGLFSSYFILPIFLQTFFDSKIQIYLLDALSGVLVASCCSCFTIFLSCYKPIKIIAKMQPIDTIHFENCKKLKIRENNHYKNRIFYMALRNLQRKKKNTYIIILSFIVGSLAFLAFSQFYESIDPKQYVDAYYKYDIEITDESEETNQITYTILDKIKKLSGIETLEVIERQTIYIEYDTKIFSKYLIDFQKKAGIDISTYPSDMISQQFWTYAYILPDKHKENTETKTLFLSEEYKNIFPLGTKLEIKNSRTTCQPQQ